MESITKLSVFFCLALAFSLAIERILETLKLILVFMDSRLHGERMWNRLALRLRNRLELKMGVFEYVSARGLAALLDRFHDVLLEKKDGYQGTVPLLSADLLRSVYIRVACKIVGIGLGVAVAFWMEIDFVQLWTNSGFLSPANQVSPVFNHILSGVVIGLGSSPVHKVIRAIEEKKKKREEGQNG